jgi:formamidopyrimidine-DNA glycosylase
MPELPEVETMRRQLTPIVGSEILEVCRPRWRLRPIGMRPAFVHLRKILRNSRVAEITRLGKRIVLWTEKGSCSWALVIEPRMTGCVTLSLPPDDAHTRLVLRLNNEAYPVVYFWDSRGLGQLQLLNREDYSELAQSLGPDALEVSADYLRQRLGRSGRPIKLALMDQQVLAGIGNLYASEILLAAKIHPASRCRNLSDAHWRALVRAIGQVLQRAIEAQGSTLADETYRNPRGQPGTFQFQHYVYQKDGHKCRRCNKAVIMRIRLGGRSTFFCPVCQPIV